MDKLIDNIATLVATLLNSTVVALLLYSVLQSTHLLDCSQIETVTIVLSILVGFLSLIVIEHEQLTH